jgi:hypothetical protein
MCDDCQAFARYLEQPGVLDAHGGTDIYQTAPAHVQLSDGAEHVRCVRLSPKGLLRWYTACCNTPIGNTLASPGVPFVALVHSFMDHSAPGQARDRVLGAPRAFIHGRFGIGGLPAHAHPRAPLGIILRMASQVGTAWLKRRQRPSAFFTADTGAPRVTPLVLTLEQRRTLTPAVA